MSVRVEPESNKSNVNDVLNWLSIVQNITASFQSVSYNLHAPIWITLRKRGVSFYICFRKKGVLRKEGGSLGKGRVPNLEETMSILWQLKGYLCYESISLQWSSPWYVIK